MHPFHLVLGPARLTLKMARYLGNLCVGKVLDKKLPLPTSGQATPATGYSAATAEAPPCFLLCHHPERCVGSCSGARWIKIRVVFQPPRMEKMGNGSWPTLHFATP